MKQSLIYRLIFNIRESLYYNLDSRQVCPSLRSVPWNSRAKGQDTVILSNIPYLPVNTVEYQGESAC